MSRFFALVAFLTALTAAACSDGTSLTGLDAGAGQARLHEGTDPSSSNGQCGGCKP